MYKTNVKTFEALFCSSGIFRIFLFSEIFRNIFFFRSLIKELKLPKEEIDCIQSIIKIQKKFTY